MCVAGPEAGDYLQRMVSNDVLALRNGESCDALLLTPKARVIATLRIVRRDDGDFLLLTEPELGELVRAHLLRSRFAARCEIELEDHSSAVVFGEPEVAGTALRNDDYGRPAVEVLDVALEPTVGEEQLELMRIEAGTPRHGVDIDERVLPAEAGLVERAVSLTKGCYPGQEPVARLHYRGHANRSLRVLRIEAEAPPPRNAEIVLEGKVVGRITSAARAARDVAALGFVRVEVPDDAELAVSGAPARIAPALS